MHADVVVGRRLAVRCSITRSPYTATAALTQPPSFRACTTSAVQCGRESIACHLVSPRSRGQDGPGGAVGCRRDHRAGAPGAPGFRRSGHVAAPWHRVPRRPDRPPRCDGSRSRRVGGRVGAAVHHRNRRAARRGLAEQFDLHPQHVRTAIDFAAMHRQEIDAQVAANDAAAEEARRLAERRSALMAS